MIGIFDSGIGGLSVVKVLWRHLPQYKIIYFGDTARFPYGAKGPEIIKKYARENTEFLIKKGAKVIIVACNTASAVALEDLRKKFLMPIFGVIDSAADQAVRLTKNKKIGVIGTRATIGSKIYEKKIKSIDPQIKVFSQACPLLVSLVEENWINRSETKSIVKKYLQPLKNKKIDTLILGCTHYPFIKNITQKEMGRSVRLVDSGEELILFLKNFLASNAKIEKSLARGKNHQFFVSDLTPHYTKIAKKWLNKNIKWRLIRL